MRALRSPGGHGAPARSPLPSASRERPVRGAGCAATGSSSSAVVQVAAGSPPWSAARAGRTNSWKVTIAETGLPGRPKASVSSRVPNQTGLPGRRLTPQKSSCAPSARSAPLTWSCGPTETPPDTTTTSADSSAPRDRGARGLGAVAHALARHQARRPPARPARSGRSRWSCRCRPARSGSPGSVSSSPVTQHGHPRAPRAGERGATDRGRHAQGGRRRARRPRAARPRPAPMSSPARRMLAPGSVAGTRTPSRRCARCRSTGTTAVAPSGRAAPVEIAMAAPGCTARLAPDGPPGPRRPPPARRPARRPRRSRPSRSCRTAAPRSSSPRPRPAPVRAPRTSGHRLGRQGAARRPAPAGAPPLSQSARPSARILSVGAR